MKFGTLSEVVIYTEFGTEHKALVIGSRELEHHTGENGEQLLNLVIVKPVVLDECVKCHFPERNHGKPFPPGVSHVPCAQFEGIAPVAAVNPSEYVHIVTDVAHESHAFTDDQLKEMQAKGLTAYPGGQFPGGRWREIGAVDLPPSPVSVSQAEWDAGRLVRGTGETPPVEIVAISLGASVVTTEENADMVNGWTDEAKANRRWGVKGVVVAEHNSHGLCFDVRHEDGTVGSYDSSELNIIEAEPAVIQ